MGQLRVTTCDNVLCLNRIKPVDIEIYHFLDTKLRDKQDDTRKQKILEIILNKRIVVEYVWPFRDHT